MRPALTQAGGVGGRHVAKRQTHRTGVEAHHVERSLRRNRIHFIEERVHEVEAADLLGGRFGGAAREPVGAHLRTGGGVDVGVDADDARAAHAHDGDRDVVVAGPHLEVGAEEAGDLHGVAHVARSFLDAADVRVLREALDDGDRDGAARAARHVVEDAGHGDGVGRVGEVAVHALGVGLVVVRGDDEERVGAHRLVAAAHLDLRGRAVGARADDDGHASRDRVDRVAHDGGVLLVRHRGVFTRRAERENGARAAGDLALDEMGEGFEVHASVFVEGRDHGDDGASDVFELHRGSTSETVT